ncbi:unnamed protein product [Coregonus sp. 'balchen']|nr:unnamed protein product [Coregonus sp. 'balchen']
MRKIYTTVLFANIYLAPLSLIVIMYARIGFTLFKMAVPASGGGSGSGSSGGTKPGLDNHHQMVSKKKKRVIKMLLMVALLFILSWLPLWTLMMLSDYASLTASQHRVINIYVYPLAHWLAFFNSSINPIIYGFFNENFRRGFKAAFKFQLCTAYMERQRTYSHRIQGNAVLPANLHLPTRPGSARSGLALVNWKGLGREEVVGRTSDERSSGSNVKEQDLIMKDLEKVSQV